MVWNLALIVCVGCALVISTIELVRSRFTSYIIWAVWLLALAMAIGRVG